MISSNDFRTGTSIELDGQVWRVVEFLHVKPGKGSAFVRTKLKAVQSGNVVEKTFRAGETVPQAVLEKSTLQHTYMEGEDYVFMDMATFEETRLTGKQIGESRKYLKEGMEVSVVAWNGKPLEVELPNSVVLEITQTDPGVKGDTATGGTKPAIVETGAQVMGSPVPLDWREDQDRHPHRQLPRPGELIAMQLDHDQLRQLITLLGESDIQELKLEGDDFRLELRRNLPASQPQVVMQAAPAQAMVAAPVAAAAGHPFAGPPGRCSCSRRPAGGHCADGGHLLPGFGSRRAGLCGAGEPHLGWSNDLHPRSHEADERAGGRGQWRSG
jgi:elongation factor P